MIGGGARALDRLLAALCLLSAFSSPAATADGASLAECEAPGAARSVHDKSRELADHLLDGYATSHPAAVVLARSMAEISATLDAQLLAVEPSHEALQADWAAFERAVRGSPLARDPALGRALSGFRQAVGELEGLLGCGPSVEGSSLVPCPAIPLAHLLAVVGETVKAYVEAGFGDSLPEQAEAAGELARAATRLHQVLHDLEIAVPGTRRTFVALDTALAGSSLTDTDEPQDVEVKKRLAAVGEAVSGLAEVVGSCRAAAEAHAGH